ncbi:hypothetical protein [Fodinicurvata sp. EGI_FJ10296]|uniref:hypothetical protein n=1 Tax=Fodinicurvata sp. EGI_FJ10296 TaxID=3231908 RepID=UPI003451C323
MSVIVQRVYLDNGVAGDAVSIDRKMMFFTTRAEFVDLDGKIFEDMDSIHRSIKKHARAIAEPAIVIGKVKDAARPQVEIISGKKDI